MNVSKLALVAALTAAVGTMSFAPVANAAPPAPPAPPAYSDTGTITVKGLVVAKTCTITFTGATQTGNDATVTLPTVLTSDFAATREVAGAGGGRTFNMKIDNCDPAYKHLDLVVSAQSAIDADGNLVNDIAAPAGSNVAVRMFPGTDNSGTPINFTATPGWDSGPQVLTAAGFSFDFFAEYYGPAALGTASAGSVQSVAKYTVTYN